MGQKGGTRKSFRCEEKGDFSKKKWKHDCEKSLQNSDVLMMYYLNYKSIFSLSHKFGKYFTLENTKGLFRRTQICCSSGLQKISIPREGFESWKVNAPYIYRNGIIHFYFICNACCNFVDEEWGCFYIFAGAPPASSSFVDCSADPPHHFNPFTWLPLPPEPEQLWQKSASR